MSSLAELYLESYAFKARRDVSKEHAMDAIHDDRSTMQIGIKRIWMQKPPYYSSLCIHSQFHEFSHDVV